MKKLKFDVFVIGSGVAGKTVAEKCKDAGLKVAIAEKREFGGTCSNRGCDPKKVLLGPTQILQQASDLMGKGISEVPALDWKALQKFKKTFTSAIPKKTKKDFDKKGIVMFYKSPKFIGENTVKIGDNEITASSIVIATGLVPRKLDLKGNTYLKDSDDFLSLKKLPKKLIFIGAGYIGMEFAQMAARAGSNVTVMDHGDRPLSAFDGDIVSSIEKASKDLGIKFFFNSDIDSIKKKERSLKLYHKTGSKMAKIKADLIFNTSGRIPALEKLHLDKGNVARNERGVAVDEFLRSTTNSSVYACGDASDHSLPLSPLAGYEANIVAKNIIEENDIKINIPFVPSVVFTIPSLASVGYSEEDAKKRYKNVTVKFGNGLDWYNNQRINGAAYAYKILINDRTDKIVGVHLVGPEAGEIINLFTMAMNSKIKVIEIKKMIFTYPSWSNDIKAMLS